MHREVPNQHQKYHSGLFFRKIRVGAAVMVLMTLVVASLRLLAQSQGHADLPKEDTVQPSTTITSLTYRSLRKTHFFVLGQDLAVQTSCGTAGCQSAAPVFTPNIQCPGPVLQTCTYHIQVSAQVSVTPSDFGQYRFLIDGVPPVQFQTDFSGYFNWEQQNPNSGVGVWQARPYAVVAIVKNRVANQNHKIEVDIACLDTTSDGCGAAFGFGGLRVDVFTP